MGRIVNFGEIMLRLTPPGHTRFVQAERFDIVYGGTEANVAVALAQWDMDSCLVTRLPAHELGQAAVNFLRRYGVDTTFIARGGERIGVYYLEQGASQRSSKVIYDRARSAFAQATEDAFDWDAILAGADWFHFTGITAALGAPLAGMCLAACKQARARGVTVSCDINYRKNLWREAEAGATLEKIMPYVDVCIANEEQARVLFGIACPDEAADLQAKSRYAAEQLHARFGCRYVALTLRSGASADNNTIGAMLYDGETHLVSRFYDVHIVDRVGGGDAFDAGLIYGLCKGLPARDALDFAMASDALKHSIPGDTNHVCAEEVWALAHGDGSGRVQR
nr:sugar kinase [Maliibacterium massiliense]